MMLINILLYIIGHILVVDLGKALVFEILSTIETRMNAVKKENTFHARNLSVTVCGDMIAILTFMDRYLNWSSYPAARQVSF